MDPLANLMPQIAELGLTPEQQQKLLDYLNQNPGAVPQQIPVLSNDQIGGIVSSRRTDASIDTERSRLERALAKQQGADADLMAGISGPRGVPTPFGAVMVRQSPLMNIVKAVRSFKRGADVGATESEIAGLQNQQANGLESYLGALNEQNRMGNQNAQRSALAEAIRKLGMGGY